jgi:hypothetical protein
MTDTTNMRTLINLFEDREINNPDVSYELAGTTKAKTAAEEFSKITAYISGRTSEWFTKLAKKFKQIDDLNKQMNELRNEANQEAKDALGDLFNAEDEIYTRYVDTVSLSITMSKAIEAKTTTTETLFIDDFLADLMKLVDTDLLPAVTALVTQHTKITTRTSAAQQGRVTVNLPKPEPTAETALNEDGMREKIANFVAKFSAKIMKFNSRYDDKLAAIAQKYNLD